MSNLCRKCFCFLNAISTSTLKRLIRQKRRGAVSSNRRAGSGKKRSSEWMTAWIWFGALVTLIGEPSPQSNNVYLPPGFRRDYFNEYLAENQGNLISEAAFYEMWRKQFSHVKVSPCSRFYSIRYPFVSGSANAKFAVNTKRNLMLLEILRYNSSNFIFLSRFG